MLPKFSYTSTPFSVNLYEITLLLQTIYVIKCQYPDIIRPKPCDEPISIAAWQFVETGQWYSSRSQPCVDDPSVSLCHGIRLYLADGAFGAKQC